MLIFGRGHLESILRVRASGPFVRWNSASYDGQANYDDRVPNKNKQPHYIGSR